MPLFWRFRALNHTVQSLNKGIDGAPAPPRLSEFDFFAWDSPGEAMYTVEKALKIQSDISDSEARLIAALEDQTTQRNLARATGFSLGMTNLLIKRLVKKGLIKVVTMNGRTLSYILTPTGFAEKLKRSYDYVTASMRYIAQVRERIRIIVTAAPQESPVYIVGSGELLQLTQETLREIGVECNAFDSFEALPKPGNGRVCLICEREFPAMSDSADYLFRTVVP